MRGRARSSNEDCWARPAPRVDACGKMYVKSESRRRFRRSAMYCRIGPSSTIVPAYVRKSTAVYAALMFKRRRMAFLGQVVDPSTGFDEDVFEFCELRDFGRRRRIAARLIVTILRHWGQEAKARLKKRLAATLSRGFCSRISVPVRWPP